MATFPLKFPSLPEWVSSQRKVKLFVFSQPGQKNNN